MSKTTICLERKTKIEFDLLKVVKQVDSDTLMQELIEFYKQNSKQNGDK